ncbi:MAG: HesA/MoeB/ThiF family protein [Clostridia bacterium]|nr:HesA/MoeB/ThiF family protein [Clostridia bacterium]
MHETHIRQTALPQIGERGQQQLQNASVLICGLGGLGCPCAEYLASMGIGTIGLCDGDTVQESNLNRQILYSRQHIGQSKVDVAAKQLQQQFPDTRFVVHHTFLTKDNANELIRNYTCVADCLDTWEARLLLNDACVLENIPFIHAAVRGFCGQVIPVLPNQTACLRCLQITPPANDPSVLGAAAGAIACLQATQICLVLTSNKTANGIFMLDTTTLESVLLPMDKNKDCICSKNQN